MTNTRIAPQRQPSTARHSTGSAADAHTKQTGRAGRVSPFWRQFLQMLAAMMIGMIATGAIFLSVVGAKTWDEVTTEYPTQALLAMAAGMSVPMVAWMVFRGMGRRHSYEMAAVMIVPVIPFLCLVWFGVTDSAWCGPYCLVTIVAMLGLMTHRREHYSATSRR